MNLQLFTNKTYQLWINTRSQWLWKPPIQNVGTLSPWQIKRVAQWEPCLGKNNISSTIICYALFSDVWILIVPSAFGLVSEHWLPFNLSSLQDTCCLNGLMIAREPKPEDMRKRSPTPLELNGWKTAICLQKNLQNWFQLHEVIFRFQVMLWKLIALW